MIRLDPRLNQLPLLSSLARDADRALVRSEVRGLLETASGARSVPRPSRTRPRAPPAAV
jgi:hypothetical protein